VVKRTSVWCELDERSAPENQEGCTSMAFLDISALPQDDSSEWGGVITADVERTLSPGEQDGDAAPPLSLSCAVVVSASFTGVSTFVTPVLVHFLK
jgi:hypothetical protein